MRRSSVLLIAFLLVTGGIILATSQVVAEEVAPICQDGAGQALPELMIFLPAAGKMAINSVCTANCYGAGTASCSGTSCSAEDRNCSIGQRGYAVCDGTYYFCNSCPAPPPPTCNPPCKIQCGITGGICMNGNQCACY
jgi:hypothetical protein